MRETLSGKAQNASEHRRIGELHELAPAHLRLENSNASSRPLLGDTEWLPKNLDAIEDIDFDEDKERYYEERAEEREMDALFARLADQ